MSAMHAELAFAAEPSESDRDVIQLRRALSELLEQVQMLDGFELSRDLEPYKAEAVWDAAIFEAEKALRDTQ